MSSRVESAPIALDSWRRGVVIGVYAVVFFGTLPVLLSLIGARLDELLRWARLGPGWRAVGAGLCGLGTAGVAWAMWHLRRHGRGWPISHLPPARLVRGGPYRMVRHPIYVAYTLGFVGAGLGLGSPGHAFAAGALLLAGWSVYALGFEEPKLIRRFGESYVSYRDAVPLLPLPGRRRIARVAAVLWGAARPGVERIANHVVLFRVGRTVWVTYGAFLALGALAMGSLTGGLLVQAGRPPSEVGGYLIELTLAMLIGGRLVWLAYQWRPLRDDPATVLRTVGFVSWGGLLAAIVFPLSRAALGFGAPLWLLDRTLLGLLACAMLGRLACLTYGCCFGRRSEAGVRWTHPDAKMNRQPGTAGKVPRVPSQLLEAGWLLAVLGCAFGATRSAAPAGTLSGIALGLYALGRFACDCLREEERFGPWRVTAGQVGSVIVGALGLALLFSADGPSGWSPGASVMDLAAALRVWPAIVTCAALVFVVMGFHWRRVGRW